MIDVSGNVSNAESRLSCKQHHYSPLQSLMKEQVDNLADRGITDAVTINGLLDPISRSLSVQRVLDGDASLLYIAPEMLRSKTNAPKTEEESAILLIDMVLCGSRDKTSIPYPANRKL